MFQTRLKKIWTESIIFWIDSEMLQLQGQERLLLLWQVSRPSKFLSLCMLLIAYGFTQRQKQIGWDAFGNLIGCLRRLNGEVLWRYSTWKHHYNIHELLNCLPWLFTVYFTLSLHNFWKQPVCSACGWIEAAAWLSFFLPWFSSSFHFCNFVRLYWFVWL